VHLAAGAVAALFSLNYVISKLGMHAFSPLAFAYLRVLGSAMVLNALLPRSRERWSRGDWGRVTGYSVLGVVINQALFLNGLALTSAHVAAILMTAIPLFALGAAIVMGRERATGAKVAGITLAFGGALVIVAREGLEGAAKSLTGDLLLLGNALAYSLYLVLSKRDMKRLGPHRVIARMFGIATVLMVPLCVVPLARESWPSIPPRAWLALLLVIAGPTVAAYLLNAWALAHADSSLVAAYTYLQPVLTAALAAALLDERIGWAAAVAAVIIFSGVWLAGRRGEAVAEAVISG
jgi:drug/metabolite transporter (DMT)-like permease